MSSQPMETKNDSPLEHFDAGFTTSSNIDMFQASFQSDLDRFMSQLKSEVDALRTEKDMLAIQLNEANAMCDYNKDNQIHILTQERDALAHQLEQANNEVSKYQLNQLDHMTIKTQLEKRCEELENDNKTLVAEFQKFISQ